MRSHPPARRVAARPRPTESSPWPRTAYCREGPGRSGLPTPEVERRALRRSGPRTRMAECGAGLTRSGMAEWRQVARLSEIRARQSECRNGRPEYRVQRAPCRAGKAESRSGKAECGNGLRCSDLQTGKANCREGPRGLEPRPRKAESPQSPSRSELQANGSVCLTGRPEHRMRRTACPARHAESPSGKPSCRKGSRRLDLRVRPAKPHASR